MLTHVEAALKKYWGYEQFRPLQKQAIESVLAGRDSVVVMPTGGGKSLCFQAPALVLPGMAVVVSPLISLMKDQVDALTECGIAAARLDSSQNSYEQNNVFQRVLAKNVKILYLSPERLVMDGFIDRLKQVDISLIAIDEAHCISAWGHDFRPEYRQLKPLKKLFPGIAVHSYTATATAQVRYDIASQLGLENPQVLVGSFDRPNLVYRVEEREKGNGQILDILDRHKGDSGIIYCIRRADVEDMCGSLSAKGYRVAPYHAGNGQRGSQAESGCIQHGQNRHHRRHGRLRQWASTSPTSALSSIPACPSRSSTTTRESASRGTRWSRSGVLPDLCKKRLL